MCDTKREEKIKILVGFYFMLIEFEAFSIKKGYMMFSIHLILKVK